MVDMERSQQKVEKYFRMLTDIIHRIVNDRNKEIKMRKDAHSEEETETYSEEISTSLSSSPSPSPRKPLLQEKEINIVQICETVASVPLDTPPQDVQGEKVIIENITVGKEVERDGKVPIPAIMTPVEETGKVVESSQGSVSPPNSPRSRSPSPNPRSLTPDPRSPSPTNFPLRTTPPPISPSLSPRVYKSPIPPAPPFIIRSDTRQRSKEISNAFSKTPIENKQKGLSQSVKEGVKETKETVKEGVKEIKNPQIARVKKIETKPGKLEKVQLKRKKKNEFEEKKKDEQAIRWLAIEKAKLELEEKNKHQHNEFHLVEKARDIVKQFLKLKTFELLSPRETEGTPNDTIFESIPSFDEKSKGLFSVEELNEMGLDKLDEEIQTLVKQFLSEIEERLAHNRKEVAPLHITVSPALRPRGPDESHVFSPRDPSHLNSTIL
eukprot:TRINITY_DN10125_c0_g1_i2.p1 TRINITY_DN10125_c0_g1~~TRINITY_DN10125_c0_g1_i2.p1  ORF type:complete len:464 (-),score=181.37 TRINITY_DN10125_c0_g1_i2:105-1418(-)